jgi:2-polyprenyl-3-methyl-5-hydroxy-6-metoxy-1,4-benzoquinol methylase
MPPHPEGEIFRCPDCTHAFTVPESIAAPETYDSSYFLHEHRRWFENPDVDLFARVLAQIPGGASVLDVGCGRGGFLRFARGRRPDLELTGIDVAPNQAAEGIRFIQGDILRYPLHEQFDAVLSFQVIEHLPDVGDFLDRLLQLVRPGGMLVVTTPNAGGLLYSTARIGRAAGLALPFNRLYSKHHLQHFTRQSLARLLGTRDCTVDQHWDHNAPIKAMDLPVTSRAADAALRGGLWVLWGAGRMLGRSYLQTAICRRVGSQSGKSQRVADSARAIGSI